MHVASVMPWNCNVHTKIYPNLSLMSVKLIMPGALLILSIFVLPGLSYCQKSYKEKQHNFFHSVESRKSECAHSHVCL